VKEAVETLYSLVTCCMLEVVLTGCTLNTLSAAEIVAERCWPRITGDVWFGCTQFAGCVDWKKDGRKNRRGFERIRRKLESCW